MCSYIDLHMHTKYSDDGQFEPAKLVDMCKEAGEKRERKCNQELKKWDEVYPSY